MTKLKTSFKRVKTLRAWIMLGGSVAIDGYGALT
jgi:hypothetical protein